MLPVQMVLAMLWVGLFCGADSLVTVFFFFFWGSLPSLLFTLVVV